MIGVVIPWQKNVQAAAQLIDLHFKRFELGQKQNELQSIHVKFHMSL